MSVQWLQNNPFGKLGITIELDNLRIETVRIAPSNGKRGIALIWGGAHAELDWTDQEIFATIEGGLGKSTYIFSKDGTGFLIGPTGRQSKLNWY